MRPPTIAIVGAGIAGLTAALAFARRGADVVVMEQAEAISAVGAGLQLSPNATRILGVLGLGPVLETAWMEPDRVALVCGRTLAPLAAVPAGKVARARWGAPYAVMHRAGLQEALMEAVRREPGISLLLGARPATESTSLLAADIMRRTARRADLVVAADGVWSRLRRLVPGHGRARFSGYIAWRMMVPRAGADVVDAAATTAYLGPSTHLVAYPLGPPGGVNLVAITRGRNPGETWQREAGGAAGRDALSSAFHRWHPKIRALLDGAGEATVWPLFEVEDGSWSAPPEAAGATRLEPGATGGLAGPVLIGDAAHAMLPFAAQGAAAAIEDGFELAAAVIDAAGTLRLDALDAFLTRRKRRIARIRARGAFNRFAYHARGPIRIGRNVVLAMRRPESLAADLDWLYGYRA